MERYILREQEFYTGIPLPDGCEDMAAGEGYVLVVKAADAQAAVEALQAQLAQQGEEVQRWKGKYDVAQTNAQTWLNKYQDMVAWSDKQNGTPCEQVRHQQQVEALQRERDFFETAAATANRMRVDTERALDAERDRLLKIVEYGAAIDNALFMRGEHVETYEARCRYLADRCRKLLAALTPGEGGQDE